MVVTVCYQLFHVILAVRLLLIVIWFIEYVGWFVSLHLCGEFHWSA